MAVAKSRTREATSLMVSPGRPWTALGQASLQLVGGP